MNGTRRLIAAATLVCAWTALADTVPADGRIQLLSEPDRIEDFSLTNQDGQLFRFSQLRGRDSLVFFGFTHCPRICPTAMFKMKAISETLEKTGEAPPTVVLISIDGERDSPEVMKAYLAPYPKSFIGLTGDPKDVRKIAAGFKAIFFKGLPYDNLGNYQVEHTSLVYLVDREGRLKATFLDAPVESMVAATRQLSAQAR